MNKGTEEKNREGEGERGDGRRRTRECCWLEIKRKKEGHLNKYPSTVPTYHSLPPQLSGKLLLPTVPLSVPPPSPCRLSFP